MSLDVKVQFGNLSLVSVPAFSSRSKAVASTLKVVRPGSRCGCSRKWVWSCKEVGVIEERR